VLLPEEVALGRFRPEGYSDEIKLSDDARTAREDLLKADSAKLADGQPVSLITSPPAPEPEVKPPPATNVKPNEPGSESNPPA
jgi:hypothetical protein